MCRVSVVIPNYNGKIYLKDCMKALKGQTFQDFELIFVDNGSTDDSLEFLKACYPEARVLQLSENYGFCRAVNEGVKLSRAEYVILLNNDTKAMPDFIRELVNTMDAHGVLLFLRFSYVQNGRSVENR